MAKYVPDVKTQRWVIISPRRTKRPDTAGGGKEVKNSACPFCAENEADTPPETYRIGTGEKDGPGWQVRVVPNKYPITDIHEVIIHSPDHERDIESLTDDQVIRILTCYRDLYRAHEDDGQVLIFCNHGANAGASLAHPHSQLVVVPRQINLDTLVREPVTNMVSVGKYFVAYCPDFSQWPYEVWLAPKDMPGKFVEVAGPAIIELATLVKTMLGRLARIQNTPGLSPGRINEPFVYNYYIFQGEHWYFRIIPRFIHRAGFELGTGLNVNVVDPMDAAEQLKKNT